MININNLNSYFELDSAFDIYRAELLKAQEDSIINSYNTAYQMATTHQSQAESYNQEDNPEHYNSLLTLASQWMDKANSILAANPWIHDVEATKPIFNIDYPNNLYNDLRKKLRTKLVSNIIVTSSKGNSFNGDETSQTRITRAIAALPDNTTKILWTLANNSKVEVMKPELQEVLLLAGIEQTKLW